MPARDGALSQRDRQILNFYADDPLRTGLHKAHPWAAHHIRTHYGTLKEWKAQHLSEALDKLKARRDNVLQGTLKKNPKLTLKEVKEKHPWIRQHLQAFYGRNWSRWQDEHLVQARTKSSPSKRRRTLSERDIHALQLLLEQGAASDEQIHCWILQRTNQDIALNTIRSYTKSLVGRGYTTKAKVFPFESRISAQGRKALLAQLTDAPKDILKALKITRYRPQSVLHDLVLTDVRLMVSAHLGDRLLQWIPEKILRKFNVVDVETGREMEFAIASKQAHQDEFTVMHVPDAIIEYLDKSGKPARIAFEVETQTKSAARYSKIMLGALYGRYVLKAPAGFPTHGSELLDDIGQYQFICGPNNPQTLANLLRGRQDLVPLALEQDAPTGTKRRAPRQKALETWGATFLKSKAVTAVLTKVARAVGEGAPVSNTSRIEMAQRIPMILSDPKQRLNVSRLRLFTWDKDPKAERIRAQWDTSAPMAELNQKYNFFDVFTKIYKSSNQLSSPENWTHAYQKFLLK